MEQTTDSKSGVFQLGSSDESIGITNGPGDWDLRLALRKTVPEGWFHLNRTIAMPPFCDAATMFYGRLTVMAAAGDEQGKTIRWRLEGDVYKGHMRSKFTFRALYNSEEKTGHVVFRDR